MASNQPTQEYIAQLSNQVSDTSKLNREIKIQSSKWNVEAHLYDFECAIDMLDKITDSLPEDRITTNALNGLHDKFSKIYADFRAKLLFD